MLPVMATKTTTKNKKLFKTTKIDLKKTNDSTKIRLGPQVKTTRPQTPNPKPQVDLTRLLKSTPRSTQDCPLDFNRIAFTDSAPPSVLF